MGKCEFRSDWLLKTDPTGYKISSWCKKVSDSKTDIFCQICLKTLSISAKGFQTLTQHAETALHKDNAKVKLGALQLRLIPCASSTSTGDTAGNTATVSTSSSEPTPTIKCVKLYDVRNAAAKAELIWAMKNVDGNMSAGSCNGIADTFRAMFPSSVTDGFTLGSTKLSYLITDALAPHFRAMFLDEACSSYYSLIYDETINAAGHKELQTIVRYWSNQEERVVIKHLQTFFMGHADGESLFKNICLAIENAQLPYEKLLMFGSDGPNVNKKVWKLMNEKMKSIRGSRVGILDVGTCNIHIVHNSFLKCLEVFGSDVSDLLLSLYYFFDDFPNRWEDYYAIQKDKHVPLHTFIKHVSARWLTILPAAERLLEQLIAVKEYFLKFIPKTKTYEKVIGKSDGHCQKIVRHLKSPIMKAEILFVVSVAKIFTRFTGTFQREEPLIHVVYYELKSLVTILMGRFVKTDILSKLEVFEQSFFKHSDNFLPLVDVECGSEVKEHLLGVSDKTRLDFSRNVRDGYIAACVHIIKKTAISSSLMKRLGCIHPEDRKSERSCRDIVKIASYLPFLQLKTDVVLDEWKLLQQEEEPHKMKTERIDEYWQYYFSLKNATGGPKYPNTTLLIKACLSLSHGSADVERGFSKSGRTLTNDKCNMSVHTLNARLTVADGMKKFHHRPELVPITNDLLTNARLAHSSYMNYLEEQKKIKEAEVQKKKEDENIRKQQEEAQREMEVNKKAIGNLESELKKAKAEKEAKEKVTDKLFKEANERLKTALKKNDLVEVQIAQAMLDGVMNQRTQERAKAEEVNKIQSRLNKRKDTLISSNVAAKKPKFLALKHSK